MTEQEALQWSSHLAPLLACVTATEDKPVLEIGIGHFSTPILNAICTTQQRFLCSVETDKDWMRMLFPKYQNPFHSFKYSINAVPDVKWGVVFIDDSPGGQNRLNHFREFITKSDYVVVHDYWRENFDMIHPTLEGYGCNWSIVSRPEPPTLIATINRRIPAVFRKTP